MAKADLRPPWKKGQSGNPTGKQKGQPDWRTHLRGMFESNSTKLVQVVIDKALEGDMTALKLCLERVLPALKPVDDIRVIFPSKATMVEQLQALKTAVCEGRLPATEAGAMVRLSALEIAAASAAEGGKGLSAEDVIRLLNSEVLGV